MALLRFLIISFALASWASAIIAGEHTQEGAAVELHFFWSRGCPHCQAARPFVEALPGRLPWLRLHSLEVGEPANGALYDRMAQAIGEDASSVPAFLFCGRMMVGFDAPETTGAELVAALEACRAGLGPGAPETLRVPVLGELHRDELSLPLLTLVIAGLDAFNPCAFFVLLFLLSLLVHARSRARILFVGGTFVLFSGLIYFLFMAAWLHVFRWAGELRAVTVAAGFLAVGVAAINVKDYFLFRRGVSLSIPEAAKPGLFQRMRGLLRADSLPAMTAGTVVLAVAANSYELLCTAGFPMVYTRILTLSEVGPAAHFGWLAAYNVVYVLPLLAIVLVFTWTLGGRKLGEAEGRLLKLVSGLMMFGLGLLLLFAPGLLSNPWAAALLLLATGGAAAVIHRLWPPVAGGGS